MFYDSVTKLETVTNIRVVPESQRYCDDVQNIFGNTARKLGTSPKLVKITPNACTNLARINRICDYS